MNRMGIVFVSLVIFLLGLYYLTRDSKNFGVVKSQSTSAQNSAMEIFENWTPFKPKSDLFKVLLPHPPQYAKDLVPIPGSDKKRRYDMYASEKIDGTLFLISVITYPAEIDMTESHDILKQIVDELKNSKPDNQITKVKDSLFKNDPALDFTIINKELQVEGIAFIEGKTVFVLSYVSKKDHFDQTEYQHYIDSFELLDKNGLNNQEETK